MADAYNAGKDLLRDFTTGDFRVMLLQDAVPYVFNADDEFVADLVPASTESAGGAAETITAMILYLHVTNDGDSILVGHYDLGAVAADMTGYTRQALASKTRTVDLTNDRIVYDAADPTFGGVFTVVLASTAGIGYVS